MRRPSKENDTNDHREVVCSLGQAEQKNIDLAAACEKAHAGELVGNFGCYHSLSAEAANVQTGARLHAPSSA